MTTQNCMNTSSAILENEDHAHLIQNCQKWRAFTLPLRKMTNKKSDLKPLPLAS